MATYMGGETDLYGRPIVPEDKIDVIFRYNPPTDRDTISFREIRAKAKELAEVIERNTPRCADQSAAIRKLRECVMTANASIALKGIV